MASDAAHGQVVLFGGLRSGTHYFGDTWTWAGMDWAIPFRARITLTPSSGPPGTVVQVDGGTFGARQRVRLQFIDSVNGTEELTVATTDGAGAFSTQVAIPLNATPGQQHIRAWAFQSGQSLRRTFTVT
jgi:hypothetical protein